MKTTGKRYDQQFKDDIVRLIQVEKRTIASIEKDFGVSEQTVRNWLKDKKNAENPAEVRLAELESELREAKKKISDKEMTIDILKKATAILQRTTGSEIIIHIETRHRVPG
jgi:transposase-like protein